MCCPCSSTRTSQGGSIAILKPLHHPTCDDQIPSFEEGRLLFSNTSADSDVRTYVELRGLKRPRGRNYWVTIHRDGDLNNSHTSSPNPFLSFQLDANPTSGIQLPQKLELGVGDCGIIGRRVSVMTGSASHPLTVAEGIIGWN